jgi:hypothetical protein
VAKSPNSLPCCENPDNLSRKTGSRVKDEVEKEQQEQDDILIEVRDADAGLVVAGGGLP